MSRGSPSGGLLEGALGLRIVYLKSILDSKGSEWIMSCEIVKLILLKYEFMLIRFLLYIVGSG